MATAARVRPFVPVLLAVCYTATTLLAGDSLEPPYPPPPGSVADLFVPSTGMKPPSLPSPPRPAQPAREPAPEPVNRPPVAREAPETAPAGKGMFASMKPGDRERRKLKNTSEGEWGFVNSEFVWRAPEPGYDSPFERGEWSTEDLAAVPILGPLHFFGGVEMGGDYGPNQSMTVIGRTGILWKLPVGDGMPIEVRGGPAVRYNDALNPDRVRDQAAMLWEVKAKAPLLGPVGLEYLGAATPGTTPEERSHLNQDLAVFLPVSGGKVKLGARHRWEAGQQEARSTAGTMLWYLGIEIGR